MSDGEISGPWEIPSSWSWQYIGDVCDIIGGATPSTSDPRNFEGGDIPWVTPADLSGYREKFISRGARNITKAGLESSSTRLLPQGTVLFSSRAPVGYVAIATAPLATNQGFKSFVPPAGVASDYLFYYLKRAKSLALDLASGTTFQEISGKRAGRIPLAIPPNNEQRRIVAKIEELLSDLDAGVAALERARAKLKRYRAAVLKAAVEGRLTAEWRKANPVAEPADKLLERILAERRRKWEEIQLARLRERNARGQAKYAAQGKTPPKGWKDKYPKPAKPDTANLLELPEGWQWTTLDSITEIAGGLTKGQKRKPEEKTRAVPYLRVANVQRGYLDLSEMKTIDATDAEIEELTLKVGDILFNEGGDRDKLGRGWVWAGEIDECVHQNHVFRARPVLTEIQSRFISFHGNTFGKNWFQKHGKQSVNLASINMTMLRQFPVPLPPVEEQAQIIDEVDSKLTALDHTENQLGETLARATRLRLSILKRAFEGKLVPQDPSDESASVLLERIRNARAAEGTQRAHKRRKSPA